MITPEIKVGDRVAYRAKFLRDIGDYSHARASMRGTVVKFVDWLAMVQWDEGCHSITAAKTWGVHIANLVHADHIHLEPA